MYSIAFTGHREIDPNDLDKIHAGLDTLSQIAAMTHDLFFQSGGAKGFDSMVYDELGGWPQHMLHIPFEYQREELDPHPDIIECERCPSGLYRPLSRADNHFYQDRNEHMVDLADEVICYWNGEEKGGTWNTIKYARKMGKPVKDIREF